MEPAVAHRSADVTAIALRAWGRVATAWGLTTAQAAALADMSDSTWKRARKPGYSGDLTQDQMLRLSALIGIYKALTLYFGDDIAPRWMTLPNAGPLFGGARPVDILIARGLPQFLALRSHLDALRGGV
jgi:hypothetical protein